MKTVKDKKPFKRHDKNSTGTEVVVSEAVLKTSVELSEALAKMVTGEGGVRTNDISYTDKEGKKVSQGVLDLNDMGNGLSDALRLHLRCLAAEVGNHLIARAIAPNLQFKVNVIQFNIYNLIQKLRSVLPYAVNPSVTYVKNPVDGTCHQYFMVNGLNGRIGIRVLNVKK